MADKQDRPVTLPKRGGYTGGKPASDMRPPVRTPAAGMRRRPLPERTTSSLSDIRVEAAPREGR